MRVLSYWLVSILLFSFLTTALFNTGAATSKSRYISLYQAGVSYTSGSITQNTSWTLSGSPYLITDDVFVDIDVFLTIEPGVTMEFANGKNLVIDGCLIAQGNSSDPITFTSNSSSPAPGDWGTINIRHYSTATNLLDNVLIQFATNAYTLAATANISDSYIENNINGISVQDIGTLNIRNVQVTNNTARGLDGPSTGNVTIQDSQFESNALGISIASGANLYMKNVTVDRNLGEGAHLGDSSGEIWIGHVLIENCTFTTNAGDGITLDPRQSAKVVSTAISNNAGTGLAGVSGWMYGSGLIIEDCVIQNNTNGIVSAGCEISDSTVTMNHAYGIAVSNYALVNRCNVTDNVEDGISVQRISFHEDGSATVYNSNISGNKNGINCVYGSVYSSTIENNSGAGIHAFWGVLSDSNLLEDNSYGIISEQTMSISASNTIIANNIVGVSSNCGDPTAISFTDCIIVNNTEGVIGNCFGASHTTIANNNLVNVRSSNANMQYCDIYNSVVGVQGALGMITYCNIYNCAVGVEVGSGTIVYCDIFNHTEYNLKNTDTNDINATFDWWGTSSESQIDGRIYDYYDDFNLGRVLYKPYLTAPFESYPVAAFVYEPSGPVVNDNVTFDASASYDPDGSIYSYLWDFGDGTNSTKTTPLVTHSYTRPDTYNVTLIVTDKEGLNDTATKHVSVKKQGSIISISASPMTITIGENTTIRGSLTPALHGVNATIWSRFSGEQTWDVLANVTMDENNQYAYTWVPSESGVYELEASWTGDENTFPAESSLLTLECVKIASSISISAIPATIKIGENITITGSLTPTREGVNVTIWYGLGEGSLSVLTNVTTGGNDEFSYVWTPSNSGTYLLKASWMGDEITSAAESSVVTINCMKISTSISISTDCSSAIVGFRVNVTGTLADEYGNGLRNENVVLYYTFGGIGTWTPITSDTTDDHGNYFATWIPTATGYFVLKAEWAGNATHSEMSNRTTLSSLPYNDQYVFSVESNSTISELTFNTTDRTLGFTATGPNNTEGYVKVTVAKSLIENATNVRVYLDGSQSEYTIASTEDSWLLVFNYTHSTHQIAIDLDVTVIPEFPSTTILLSFLMLLLLVIIARRKFTKRASPLLN